MRNGKPALAHSIHSVSPYIMIAAITNPTKVKTSNTPASCSRHQDMMQPTNAISTVVDRKTISPIPSSGFSINRAMKKKIRKSIIPPSPITLPVYFIPFAKWCLFADKDPPRTYYMVFNGQAIFPFWHTCSWLTRILFVWRTHLVFQNITPTA